MRASIGIEADQRPVPPPDGAVMQAEMAQCCRRLIEVKGQQNRVAGKVLGKKLEERTLKITSTEADALNASATREVHGLLKERDSRLPPQVLAKQEWRVARGRDQRARGHGRGVPIMVRERG